jgi:membrane protein
VIITVLSFLVPKITDLLHEALAFLPDLQLLHWGQYLALFVATTTLFAAFFKILPDVEISWRDVLIGAAFTSILFGIGAFLLNIYFRFYTSSIYGVAGSLIVLLLWFYYSAQIFLFGAEFTFMFANRYGSKIKPAEYTVAVKRLTVEDPETIPTGDLKEEKDSQQEDEPERHSSKQVVSERS